MKMYTAFILYALLLLLLRRVDSTSTAQPWRSFLSKTTNNNDPVIPKTVTDSDTSNFHDNMSLMNYTKFLQSKEETTTQSVTDEAEYNEWGEQGPTFILDVITTSTLSTKNDMQTKSSILDYDKEHLVPYSGNQEETVKEPNVEGREQLLTHTPDLNHKETYSLSTYKTTENSNYETDIDGPPNQITRCHETFEKMFLKSEELSPPWIKYGPMQSRNEAGQKIVPNNLSDQFRFPETRDRWWWEYEMHYMHWFFWHCEHWMIHWEINPPNLLLNNSKQEVYQDNESYRNSLENKTYKYCIWLLEGKQNQTNTEDDNILSTVNGSVRSADGKILRQYIEIAGPVVCQCYHCGYYDIEQQKQHRICHRAFTDRNYFKFQKWIKAKCRESPTKKGRHYYRSVLYDDGTIDVWGFYLKNMCVTYYSDIGELYTVRDCMKLLPYRRAWFPIAYLQKVYYALDETLRATKQLGCVATPYSFHAPFSRSRPGLFVRSYACLCQDQFRFPETRDRWWWEYEMHYMHWFFWHCEQWMTHWEINPPNLLLNNSKQEVYQDNEKYGMILENKTYKYCNWLLQGKPNQTNSEDENILSTVNVSVKRVDDNILRQHISITGPVVCQCYHCGYYDIEQQKQHRICHRAFTDKKYFKFQKWIKAKCHESRSYYARHYYRSVLYDDGTIDVWGFYLKNMCVTYYSDIGELYTVRDCMKLLPYRKAWIPIAYLQKVYYALDEILRASKEPGCIATPYSFHAPFSRSRPGLFVRSYACLCQGAYCNSSSRVQNFIRFPCTILFYFILFVYRCFV